MSPRNPGLPIVRTAKVRGENDHEIMTPELRARLERDKVVSALARDKVAGMRSGR